MDEDGFWRDYQLPPGRSEAWTTACVGHAIVRASRHAQIEDAATQRAAAALLAVRRPEGWGYNRHTACDADTTSWTIRFLAGIGVAAETSAEAMLRPYLTLDHRVRTFAKVGSFGYWAVEHDEVAPLAGLALLDGREFRQIAGIRQAILDRWARGGWQSFWWSGPAYVRAQSLEFLSRSGGIPEDIAQAERVHLTVSPIAATAFDAAQHLIASIHLLASRDIARASTLLLSLQCEDGGWPTSQVLLVPDQRGTFGSESFADDCRLLTTAMALAALTRSLECPLVGAFLPLTRST